MEDKLIIARDRLILVPNSALTTPVPMSRMQKDDENDILLNEYYSLQDLSDHFGSFYTILPWVDDFHSIATWTTIREEEMVLLKQLLTQSYGMIDIRNRGTGVELLASEINWALLPLNGFGIFSHASLVDVPKTLTPTEVI